MGSIDAPNVKQRRAHWDWVIQVPADFECVDNGDSWQAYADTRTVFVSSAKVVNGASPAPAASLLAVAVRGLAPPSDVERLQFEESGVQGEAQITSSEDGFELKGFACVDGAIATCVIAFERVEHRQWAVDSWRSLRPLPRPWWRFW